MKIPLKNLKVYGFCDPAAQPKNQIIKKVRARSAVIAIGVDDINRIFVLYAWAGRPSTPTLMKKLLEVGSAFPNMVRFGIEANAMQMLFADLVSHQARQLKKKIPFVPIMQPTKIEKFFRIRAILQPVCGMERGRLFLTSQMIELKTEILTFPVGATVDLVDALASAVAMVPKMTTPQKRSDENLALAEYLRASGMSPRYIQKRMLEVEAERPR